jgi:hypothetical protein
MRRGGYLKNLKVLRGLFIFSILLNCHNLKALRLELIDNIRLEEDLSSEFEFIFKGSKNSSHTETRVLKPGKAVTFSLGNLKLTEVFLKKIQGINIKNKEKCEVSNNDKNSLYIVLNERQCSVRFLTGQAINTHILLRKEIQKQHKEKQAQILFEKNKNNTLNEELKKQKIEEELKNQDIQKIKEENIEILILKKNENTENNKILSIEGTQSLSDELKNIVEEIKEENQNNILDITDKDDENDENKDNNEITLEDKNFENDLLKSVRINYAEKFDLKSLLNEDYFASKKKEPDFNVAWKLELIENYFSLKNAN